MSVFSSDVVVDNTVAIPVDGSAVTQPVSAASLPLPSGAATAANQTTELASLASIDAKLTSPIAVTSGGGSTATITQVSVTNASSITLKAANASRKKLILAMPAVGTALYIAFGATASTTIFTYKVTAANTVIEVTNYTGQISAIAVGATDLVNVTEIV